MGGEQSKIITLLGKCKALWGKPQIDANLRTVSKCRLSNSPARDLMNEQIEKELKGDWLEDRPSLLVTGGCWLMRRKVTSAHSHEFDCQYELQVVGCLLPVSHACPGHRALAPGRIGRLSVLRTPGIYLRLPMRKKENVEETLQPFAASTEAAECERQAVTRELCLSKKKPFVDWAQAQSN